MSNVQRPTWIQPAMAEPREEVSLYTHPRLGTPRTPCEKNLRWKFGDHCRPPSTRPPSSCRTPSASSTPWPHGSAHLFWSLSNPPPPPSQLIFLTRKLHCLSFKKVCFSTYQWALWLCTHLWSKTKEVEFEIYRDRAFCTDFVRLWGKFTSRVLPLIDRNCRSLYSGNIKWCFLLSFSIRSRASQSILAFTIVQCSNSCCKIFASPRLGGKILGPDMTPRWQKVLSAIAFLFF